jgi:hypothetical protein
MVTVSGIHYSSLARSTYEAGGSDRPLLVAAALRPYVGKPGGHYLVGGLGNDQILYMGHSPVRWFQQFDDLYIKAPIPGRGGDWHGQARGPACLSLRPQCMYLVGVAGYRLAIHEHWFSLISLWGNHGTTQDRSIALAVEQTPGYVLLTHAGGTPTWIYAPAYRSSAHTTAVVRRASKHAHRGAPSASWRSYG